MGEGQAVPTEGLTLQRLIQWTTASGAAATVLGYTAVVVQFASYSIPTAFLTLDQAARAGVAPAAVLVGVLVYGKSIMRGGAYGFRASLIPLLVPYFAVVVVMVLGLLAGLSWISGLSVSIGLMLVGWTLPGEFSMAVTGTVLLLLFVIGGLLFDRWKRRRSLRSRRVVPAPQPEGLVRTEGTPQTGMQPVMEDRQLLLMLLASPPLSGLVVYAGLYGVKAYLGSLGAGWIVQGLDAGDILVAAGIAVAVTLAASVWLWLLFATAAGTVAESSLPWFGLAQALGLFLLLLVYYSMRIYPILPPGLGGGRPERMSLWIAAEGLPAGLPAGLQSVCSPVDKLVHCRDVPVIALGDKLIAILLAGTPAIIISREAAKVIAGSGGA